jgi:hypothetical protein
MNELLFKMSISTRNTQQQQSKKRIHFTPDEDKNIIHLVSIYGTDKWKIIAGFIKNKTPRQCRERFRNYLSPNIQNLPWCAEEISHLLRLVQLHGTKWNILTSYFPGRSQTDIKNKWYSLSKNQKEIEKSEYRSNFDNLFFDFPENLEDFFLE